MVIAVDFDGTCVTDEFPKVGKEIGAAPVLKALTENGHLIVLNTMRGHYPKVEGKDVLADAIKWFEDHHIPLFGVNENPEQARWTSSPKVYAHLYIDDCALGIPLKYHGNDRPYVDWLEVLHLLRKERLIGYKQYNHLFELVCTDQSRVKMR